MKYTWNDLKENADKISDVWKKMQVQEQREFLDAVNKLLLGYDTLQSEDGVVIR